MALKTHALDALKDYLPENTLEDIIYFMETYHIHLILRKDRKSILGDYRPAHAGKPHTISLNISLNKYHFLITFIHELAHLVNYLNHQRKVLPHGKEWKQVFALLLKRFTDKSVFPDDIHQAITKSMKNLSASTCSDPALFRVLKKYDDQKIFDLIRNILKPISDLHNLNICHRDIKLENFLYETKEINAYLKLIDFGLGIDLNNH